MNSIKRAISFYKLWTSWLGEGGQPVPKDMAQGRANICLACPHNQHHPIEAFFKELAVRDLKKTVELKNSMELRVEGEKSLGICEVCACVLKLKVHVPIKFVEESLDKLTMSKLPDFCWQKKGS